MLIDKHNRHSEPRRTKTWSFLAVVLPLLTLLLDVVPAQAQTRLYFPTTEAPAVSPAFQTG